MPETKNEPNTGQELKKQEAKSPAPASPAPAAAKPATKSKSKKSSNELPLATVIRIAKKNGAERVGEDAATILAEVGEAHIAKIVRSAMTYAKVAGRKTLKKDDLDIVLKNKLE